MDQPPAFPLLALYGTHVPKIDEFWSQLFTQLAHKISPPGLNISGQTLFSMKASALSATPGGITNSSSNEMHVGSASIVSANVSQQKMSVQRGHAKLTTLLMTTRSQMTLNKPRKGRLVNGSVAIQERGFASSSSVNHGLRDLFPLKYSLSAQQFSVSLPTQTITSEDLALDEMLLALVIDSFQVLKRLITRFTFLSSNTDVLNQSTQMLERTAVMKGKVESMGRWCDLKSKMVKEELLNQFCLTMKERHQLSWLATSSLKTTIDLALSSREHKSSDVQIESGVVVSINDIEYDDKLKAFVNRRWSVRSQEESNAGESDSESDTDTDTDSQLADTDTDTTDKDTPKVSLTALKLMPYLEPSPLVAPHATIPLQRPGPRVFVVWGADDLEKLRTHHDVGRGGDDNVDLVHAYERMVIASNR